MALGGELLPWTVGVFVLAVAGWALSRRFEMAWRPAARESPNRPAIQPPAEAAPRR